MSSIELVIKEAIVATVYILMYSHWYGMHTSITYTSHNFMITNNSDFYICNLQYPKYCRVISCICTFITNNYYSLVLK